MLGSKNGRRRCLRLALVAGIGAVSSGIVIAWVLGGHLVAPHRSTVGAPPDEFPAVSVSIPLDSAAHVAGWHMRADRSRGVVVLLHPLRGTRRSMLGRARFLYEAGYSIVMIDLPAHGESPGENITFGHRERDGARAAVEFAKAQHSGEPVAVLGASLGGASALLASPLGVDALILEAVYPRIESAVENRIAMRLGSWPAAVAAPLLLVQLEPRLGISTSDLRPIDAISTVDSPVLLIGGEADLRTPVFETRELFAAAREPKELWLLDDAAHVDFHRAAPEEYERRILGFLQSHLIDDD